MEIESTNFYLYTDEDGMTKMPGFVLGKLGMSHGDPLKRIKQQEGAWSKNETIVIGTWLECKTKSDLVLHRILELRGLKHRGVHKGTEWFKFPVSSSTIDEKREEVRVYVDAIFTELEGKKVRPALELRTSQKRSLQQAIDFIDIVDKSAKRGGDIASLIAHLCPRFGKTLWALSLFNFMSEKYGCKIMFLPAFWLSVHKSFIDELDRYKDFNDIVLIDLNASAAQEKAFNALKQGKRIIIPISLCGDVASWKVKHQWLADISSQTIFMFADEGDFGTHAENQINKINSLKEGNNKFISVYASGTNVQRLAKCSSKIDGVIYTAYSELENAEPDIVRRGFYMLSIDPQLQSLVCSLEETMRPSWTKVNAHPLKFKEFLSTLVQSLVGNTPISGIPVPGLNMSALTGELINCIGWWTSSDKKQMGDLAKIFQSAIPDWHIKVLNGDYTTNKDAEDEMICELNGARIAGRKGVMFIANQMGSRSFSVPAVQACIIAYDCGSVDATTQKVSRCLTPPSKEKLMFDGSAEKKYGYIFDLSFDPNRSENIYSIIAEEAVYVLRAGVAGVLTFPQAMKFVLDSINLFKTNKYGLAVKVAEKDMFEILGDNDVMLRVADVSVDVASAMTEGLFDIFCDVKAVAGSKKPEKTVLGKGVKNFGRDEDNKKKLGGLSLSPSEEKAKKKIIEEAIHALNMSATSVRYLARNGESYSNCLKLIAEDRVKNSEFIEFFGVQAIDVIKLIDANVLNEAILDVVVQNSKPNPANYLF